MTKVLTQTLRTRGAARDLLRSRSPEVLIAGPAGTGKSFVCLAKLHLMALKNPGMKGLIVRKTAVSLTSSALKTWERDVVANAMQDGSVWFYGGSAREPAQYKYDNGSSVAIGGMDKPTKIMSTEYDVVYVQEATELIIDDWEAITTRLRSDVVSFQQVMADCNPSAPTHFLKVRADHGKLQMLHSRHEDNPKLFDEKGNVTPKGKAYLDKLDSLTGVRKLRLRDGLWAAAEGVIYEEWDDSVHLIDRFEVPRDWTRYWAIDFGYTNPFVWQDWAQDPDGRLILVREIYMTKRLVEDHAAKIMQLWRGLRAPRAVICDHDAEDRATFTRKTGFGTMAANKNVSEGLQAFGSRLRPRGDGRPGLMIMRDACIERDSSLVEARKPTCTAEEIPGYVWAQGKEQPVKEHDHGCDAGRYLVAEADLRGTTKVRFA
jgi:PBSX family phage terminase large subunit